MIPYEELAAALARHKSGRHNSELAPLAAAPAPAPVEDSTLAAAPESQDVDATDMISEDEDFA